jgi:hypothetical protein
LYEYTAGIGHIENNNYYVTNAAATLHIFISQVNAAFSMCRVFQMQASVAF